MPSFMLELPVFPSEENENLCQCVGRKWHDIYTRTRDKSISMAKIKGLTTDQKSYQFTAIIET